ncbi:hypothetical protein ACHAXR_003416 [Thalassiosira sp. AJA248-18]
MSSKKKNTLESLTVVQLKSQLQQKGLPVTGKKSELIERLNHAATGKKNLTPLQQDKEKVTIEQLKHLLRKKGLPVTGRKAELIERLKIGSKTKASPIHAMSMEQIRASDERYKQYPNFPKYYKDLKERVALEKERVRLDDILVKMHLRDCPRPALANRGYPHWNTHAAKKLLEVDVSNKLHKEKKPQELQKTRSEYREFPKDVFAKRVNQEAAKQRSARFWADKRNKKGMKRYLQDIANRSD